MGSGKSSVLDALCFALYGTFPRMSRRDQTVEQLVSMGSGAPYARVALEFERDGKKYSIERRAGKKSSDAEVRLDGKLVQKGPKQVTEFVSSALGVDYELFTRAIYSEQNRIDYLLSLNPRSRKQEIDWLLGLGQFDSAREAAQAVAGKLTEQSELFGAEAQPEKLAQAERKIAEIGAQKSEKDSVIATLSKQAGEIRKKMQERETALAVLEKSKAAWKLEQAECERQKGALARLKKETEGRKKPAAGELGLFALERKNRETVLFAARKQGRETQAWLSAMKSEIAVLESRMKTAEARQKRKSELEEKARKLSGNRSREEIEREIAELKSRIEELETRHANLHAEAGELAKAVEALSGRHGKCPVCDSELPGGKAEEISREKLNRIKTGREAGKNLAEEIAAGKKSLAQLGKNLSELSLCLAEMEGIASEVADASLMQKQLAEKTTLAKNSEAKAEKCEKENAALEAGLDEARKRHEQAERDSKLFEELGAAAARLSACEERLAKMDFSEPAYEIARRAAEEMRLSCAKADADMKGEEKQLKLLLDMLALEQGAIAALKQKRELSAKYSEASSSMAIYKNGLAAVQTELRSLLVDEINQALFEIWPAVYPYSDYGGTKLEAGEKDYRLLLQKNGEWMEVDSVASGGERACLCLALRIAFATVLTPDISWLILDEPTHNLDSEAVALLSEAIQRKIPSIVEQTFVITHDSALGEGVGGAVFVLERDKGKNEASKVEKIS